MRDAKGKPVDCVACSTDYKFYIIELSCPEEKKGLIAARVNMSS